jgi:hypothetical protein
MEGQEKPRLERAEGLQREAHFIVTVEL